MRLLLIGFKKKRLLHDNKVTNTIKRQSVGALITPIQDLFLECVAKQKMWKTRINSKLPAIIAVHKHYSANEAMITKPRKR